MSYGLGYVTVAVQLSLLLNLQLTDKGMYHDCNWQAVSFFFFFFWGTLLPPCLPLLSACHPHEHP